MYYTNYECLDCGHVASFMPSEIHEGDEENMECPVCGQIALVEDTWLDELENTPYPFEAWGYDDEPH
jgi:DNA-directed RNA polymerase subunit RPC12/RpoP